MKPRPARPVSRPLRIARGVAALLSRRREFAASLEPLAPVGQVADRSGWFCCAVPGEARFVLRFADGRVPIGLCFVSGRIPAIGSDAVVRLYHDNGGGFTQACMAELRPDARGRAAGLVYLPFGTRALCWAPQVPAGELCVEPVMIRRESLAANLQAIYGSRPVATSPLLQRPLHAGVRLALRLLRRLEPQAGSRQAYARFLARLDPDPQDSRRRAQIHQAQFRRTPLISVILPTYNTPLRYLERAVASVRRQCYPHWELCIADDASPDESVRALLRHLAAQDARIRLTLCERNGGISAASNRALATASGEFVAFLDHDDELHPLALYHVAAALEQNPALDLLYSDEDKMTPQGERYDPHLKPSWNPELLRAINYVAHLAVYRRTLVTSLGGLRSVCDGSQDYDLALRATAVIPPERIRHIPEVLYHWRAIPGSTALALGEKSYPHQAGLRALADRFEGCGWSIGSGRFPTSYRLDYPLPDPPPLVSIIVPTRDGCPHLRRCIEGLLNRTDYAALEILLVDNQSAQRATLDYFESLKSEPRVRLLRFDAPFNYSAINNFAAAEARGAVLLLLNDDTEVIHADWLREMVSLAVRPDIGAVGAKLYYADDTVQHGGVALGIGGVAGHLHLHAPRTAAGYFGRLLLRQNLSAVTAACLAVEREKYLAVGGLDETNLRVAFNDIDFCLRLGERGWRTVWTPWAELYHHESKTRGPDTAADKRERFNAERAYMIRRWGALLQNDPFYHRYLSRQRQDYGLEEYPQAWRPWQEEPS